MGKTEREGNSSIRHFCIFVGGNDVEEVGRGEEEDDRVRRVVRSYFWQHCNMADRFACGHAHLKRRLTADEAVRKAGHSMGSNAFAKREIEIERESLPELEHYLNFYAKTFCQV